MACCFRFHGGAGLEPEEQVVVGNNKGKVLFRKVDIFDGVNETILTAKDVLTSENKIHAIVDSGSQDFDLGPNDTILEASEGQVLMPGLIDAHWHTMFANLTQKDLLTSDVLYMAVAGAEGAKETLMRGFTSVRDVGGNCFAVKRATDSGLIQGPRIYPSGAFISQTSGHFDFRGPNDVPANPGDPLSYFERTGMTMIADGVDQILKRTREQLRAGACQIKLAAGGGASSMYDPIDVAEYTYGEIKAAVDVAQTWNTYVAVHAYTDRAIQTSIKAGVKSIEHGHLMSEETMQMIKDNDVWLSIQPFLNDEDSNKFPPGSPQEAKHLKVTEGTVATMERARRIGVKTAFGTDILFDKKRAQNQGKQLAKLTKLGYSSFETLKMATSVNAELLKLCGPRDPYPGELGIVKEGALADLILVNGNPLKNIQLIVDPHIHFSVIMKNGIIYKNSFEIYCQEIKS